MKTNDVRRRDFFKYLGLGSAAFALSGFTLPEDKAGQKKSDSTEEQIWNKVFSTSIVDTHEHLMDEKERLSGKAVINGKCNDWTMIFSHYIDSDMRSAGMTEKDYNRFFSPDVDPMDKWAILKPWWPYIRQTGYAWAVRISLKELYDIDELSDATIGRLQAGYEKMLHPGFYKEILKEKANIESCQVNSYPILKSEMPDFLMTDLWADNLIANPGGSEYSKPAGIEVKELEDWHAVIDWWFKKYGKYIVGVKVAMAYKRNINFKKTAADEVKRICRNYIKGREVNDKDKKKLEDHLFWYVVEKATEYHLPVKLHTGYLAQWKGKTDRMKLKMIRNNPSDACYLCDQSPDTTFIFFHLSYPYYEEMLALAKQFPNAHIDMCWSWIINPATAKEFLKKYLVTVPANKILTFGGDYVPVEPVLGHSVIARNGIASALTDLTDEGFLTLDEALSLTDSLLNGNARRIFNLEEKEKVLKGLDWAKI